MEREERIFLASLTEANQEVGRYVMRVLDEGTKLGVTEYTRPLSEVEQNLGATLSQLGHRLIERSAERGGSVVDATTCQNVAVIAAPKAPEVP
jgi:hypothetical protein